MSRMSDLTASVLRCARCSAPAVTWSAGAALCRRHALRAGERVGA